MIYRFSISGIIQTDSKICELIGDLKEALNLTADVQKMRVKLVIPNTSRSISTTKTKTKTQSKK